MDIVYRKTSFKRKFSWFLMLSMNKQFRWLKVAYYIGKQFYEEHVYATRGLYTITVTGFDERSFAEEAYDVTIFSMPCNVPQVWLPVNETSWLRPERVPKVFRSKSYQVASMSILVWIGFKVYFFCSAHFDDVIIFIWREHRDTSKLNHSFANNYTISIMFQILSPKTIMLTVLQFYLILINTF